jgi:hypothetical protein
LYSGPRWPFSPRSPVRLVLRMDAPSVRDASAPGSVHVPVPIARAGSSSDFPGGRELPSHQREGQGTIPMAWWNGPVLVFLCSLPFAAVSWCDVATGDFLLGGAVTCELYYAPTSTCTGACTCPRKRIVERAGIFFRLNGHHILHHRYMHKNFNVVLPARRPASGHAPAAVEDPLPAGGRAFGPESSAGRRSRPGSPACAPLPVELRDGGEGAVGPSVSAPRGAGSDCSPIRDP